MTVNEKKLKSINVHAVQKLSPEALGDLPEIANQQEMLKRKELRTVFEEVFKSFGPFECNDSIDRAYKDPVQMAMYVAFVQSLREMRSRLLSSFSSPKKPMAVQPPFIIARNNDDGCVTSSGKPKLYEHQATACSEAIKLTNRFNSSFSVYGMVRTYAPREKPVKPEGVNAKPAQPELNPLNVLNRLYAYLDQTPDYERPDNTPLEIEVTPTGATTVKLKNGESVDYSKAATAYRTINDFLLLHVKQPEVQKEKTSQEVVGGKHHRPNLARKQAKKPAVA